MATTKASIINMAMLRLGEQVLSDAEVTASSPNPANVANTIWDLVLEQALYEGPEEGWRFARRRYHGIDDDNETVTVIAQSGTAATDITVTVSTAHDYMVGDEVELAGDTGYDGTYDVTAISGTTTFDVTATYVATGTGTAHWRSQEYAYRYAKPTSTAIVSVQAGGAELRDWIEEGEYVLTNQESAEVDMIYVLAHGDVTIANLPAYFVDVLWRRLACHLAYDLVQNASLQQQLITELEQIYLPRAKGMDSRKRYVRESSTAWVDAGRRAMVE